MDDLTKAFTLARAAKVTKSEIAAQAGKTRQYITTLQGGYRPKSTAAQEVVTAINDLVDARQADIREAKLT